MFLFLSVTVVHPNIRFLKESSFVSRIAMVVHSHIIQRHNFYFIQNCYTSSWAAHSFTLKSCSIYKCAIFAKSVSNCLDIRLLITKQVITEVWDIVWKTRQRKFEDIRSCKSKDRQCNGQMKNDKITNNDYKNTTQTTNLKPEPHKKDGREIRCSEELAVPSSCSTRDTQPFIPVK